MMCKARSSRHEHGSENPHGMGKSRPASRKPWADYGTTFGAIFWASTSLYCAVLKMDRLAYFIFTSAILEHGARSRVGGQLFAGARSRNSGTPPGCDRNQTRQKRYEAV